MSTNLTSIVGSGSPFRLHAGLCYLAAERQIPPLLPRRPSYPPAVNPVEERMIDRLNAPPRPTGVPVPKPKKKARDDSWGRKKKRKKKRPSWSLPPDEERCTGTTVRGERCKLRGHGPNQCCDVHTEEKPSRPRTSREVSPRKKETAKSQYEDGGWDTDDPVYQKALELGLLEHRARVERDLGAEAGRRFVLYVLSHLADRMAEGEVT